MWIVACVVLAACAIGVTVWALGLNSDLNDQQAQTQAAQQQAQQAEQQTQDAIDQVQQAGQDALDGLAGTLAQIKDKLQQIINGADTGSGGGEEAAATPADTGTPQATATAAATDTPAAPTETATP